MSSANSSSGPRPSSRLSSLHSAVLGDLGATRAFLKTLKTRNPMIQNIDKLLAFTLHLGALLRVLKGGPPQMGRNHLGRQVGLTLN
jgi:hypothetical protein